MATSHAAPHSPHASHASYAPRGAAFYRGHFLLFQISITENETLNLHTSDIPDFLASSSDELSSVSEEDELSSSVRSTSMEESVLLLLNILQTVSPLVDRH